MSNPLGIVRHPISDHGCAEGAELAAMDIDPLPAVWGAGLHSPPDLNAEFVREVG
ncbi:hypothetical protein SAMN05216276_102531 [Streptosporangium subroseum]|uniref:Uncharacterized protein n=1 Tax=Streptosporangium subroseum TaxID=106412 RepID=A0A239K0Q2_9ACTN|nr:hypothetical protein [Streptosporangium subroseum]SNT11620.1 hypothetical protein SAMN05216276_102531 [Streptosporangium subroseum]